jgi:redox-sensitive bicupin YhaK (pirin superfamily)
VTSAALELVPARRREIGAFAVGRVLPAPRRRMVGPFVFLDQIGPMVLPAPVPRAADVRPHPHIGLATVTYLFDGELTHRDSLGVTQVIRPGEVNWMTAGRGITHSERFDGLRAQGGLMAGLQAWVALPREREEDAPSFEHYGRSAIAEATRPGARVRVIAGRAFGVTSPVRTASPLLYAHLELDAGATLPLDADADELAVYVVEGRATFNGQTVPPATLAVLAGSGAVLRAETPTRTMLLGGAPLGPRFLWWNFVASSRERLAAARDDWAADRFPLPLEDRDERIPLPEGSGPEAAIG